MPGDATAPLPIHTLHSASEVLSCTHMLDRVSGWLRQYLIPLLGTIFIIAVVAVISDDSPDHAAPAEPLPTQEKQVPESPPAEKPVSDSAAYIKATHFVERFLVSPSTADFPTFDYQVLKGLHDHEYYVKSYVDSENLYGAMIRNDWIAVVEFKGGKELDQQNWELKELFINGQQVFPDTP